MCLAAPAQVVAVDGLKARVARSGQEFDVSLWRLGEPVAPGDWVAVQAQRDALAVLTEAEAAEMQGLLDEIVCALRAG